MIPKLLNQVANISDYESIKQNVYLYLLIYIYFQG